MARKHQVGIEIKTTADPKGAQRVDDALENVEDQAKQLRAELAKIKGLDPAVRKQIEGVADSMDRAAMSGRKMAAGKDQVTKSSRNSGLAVLEFSRAVEDAQYGIRGVLNNIPTLLMMLGAGGGLAGVVSLAAVGLTMLVSAFQETEEEAKKVSERMEEVRAQIDALYAESARDGTSAFRAHLAAVVDGLQQENEALQRNVALKRQRRQAELEVAAAGRDLELANIAGQELSGAISATEAGRQRREIEISRIRQAAAMKQIEAQEKVQLAEEQRLDVERRRIETGERLDKAEAERVRLVEERNKLNLRRVDANAMREEGKGHIADAFFTEDMRQRLVAIEQVLLPEMENLVSTLTSTEANLLNQRMELSVAQGAAFQAAQIVEETVPVAAELKVAAIEVKAKNEQQAAAIREGNELIKQVLADGVVTAQEYSQVVDELGRFQREYGQANTSFETVARGLVSQAQLTRQEIDILKEQVKALNARSGR